MEFTLLSREAFRRDAVRTSWRACGEIVLAWHSLSGRRAEGEGFSSPDRISRYSFFVGDSESGFSSLGIGEESVA